MLGMFNVRSAPAPQPSQSGPAVRAACTAAAPRPSASLARTSPCIACTLFFDSAERGGVQPAAELRHV
eukprot:scaffold80746_cov54-Phaeocystis_antarctica.AAC.4